jgi:GNAT superfamily N-acetyltransferase
MPIHQGYLTGCIGDIVSLHARTYSQTAGFGAYFEAKVAAELSQFIGQLPHADKSLWLYVEDGKIRGSLIIDGEADLAHLRWFVLDPSMRGKGMGRQLIKQALAFVDSRFSRSYLWTFSGLDAARHLYESSGFVLTHEGKSQQWGEPVIEQRFDRSHPNTATDEKR